jgi:hypothetical protein
MYLLNEVRSELAKQLHIKVCIRIQHGRREVRTVDYQVLAAAPW